MKPLLRDCLVSIFKQAAWAPVSAYLLFDIGAGKILHIYIHYPWLDMLAHFFSGLAFTYFFIIAIVHSQRIVGHIPKVIVVVSAIGLTAMTAVSWEFYEFICDAMLGTKMNLGVRDTLSDIFFGLLGGMSMVIFAARSSHFEIAPPTDT